jgi:hypothetical protein
MGLFTERDEETPNEIIIGKLNRIEAKLDAVIKAMHDYDDENIYKGYDEPNEALLKAAGLYNEELNKEYGESSFEAFMDDEEMVLHNIPSDVLKEAADTYNEYVANKRMDIIGQNGNEGSHYVTNEEADEDAFNDYGMRVGKDKDKSNNPANTNVGKKKRDKWVSPYPPNPKRKSAVVEHVKYPPHKH